MVKARFHYVSTFIEFLPSWGILMERLAEEVALLLQQTRWCAYHIERLEAILAYQQGRLDHVYERLVRVGRVLQHNTRALLRLRAFESQLQAYMRRVQVLET